MIALLDTVILDVGPCVYPEKIQLSDEEIANLSDAQFKALVINMLTDLVESIRKTDEKMKPMLTETKENVQGTNSDEKETGTQINGMDQKEETNIQPEKNEETRTWKNEERLRNLQDTLKRSNMRIIGVPEGEEEDQKIENLFEQIMKENFPNLAKEIDFREVQEAQRVPKKLDPRRNTPRHIIITLPKIKRKDLHPRLLYPAKLSFRMEGKIKCFSDKIKLKEFIITKPLLYEMLKGPI